MLTTITSDTLFKQLTAAFKDVDHENRLRQKLFMLRQTGSVQSYIAAYRSIIVDLGDDAPNDSDQLYNFINGLKSVV